MANPVPLPVAADSTGLADSSWINDTRDLLRDYPYWSSDTKTGDGTNGVNTAGSLPFVLSRKPVADNNDPLVTVAGVTYPRDTNNPPASGKYYINYDTGELFFPSAPANGATINVNYQVVKWRDQRILSGLYQGLREMFPHIGKTYVDTSIRPQVNVWDYTLPNWCSDPRSQIYKVEVIDPDVLTQPYMENEVLWDRVGLNTIHVHNSQHFSPAGRFRISGWGPYLYLGDLEPQLYALPKWFAAGTLLTEEETVRMRQDTMIPLTQEGSRPPLANAQLGAMFLKWFYEALGRKSRLPGPGTGKRLITTYQKRSARF